MRIGAVEPRLPPVAASETPAKPAVAPVEGNPEPSPFAKMLHGLGHELTSGESMMRGAVSAAHDLGPGELIALQAGVYRYSEAIDLASRLVDHAGTSVKTVIQGGGQ